MDYFYNETIRKYIVIFGSLFSNIHVKREDPYGLNDIDVRIPIRYANKSKMYLDIKQNVNEALRPGEILLPALSFSLEEISFDNERKKLPNLLTYCNDGSTSISKTIQTPKPFNFSFVLYIWTKHETDMFQVLEQVLFNSTPSIKVTINSIPELSMKTDIAIIYESNSSDAEIGEDMTSEASSIRFHKWRVNYTLKGFLYSDITDSKIIKTVDVNWKTYDFDGNIDEDSLILNQNFQVYPYESIQSDDYKIKLTRTENESVIINFYDKP